MKRRKINPIQEESSTMIFDHQFNRKEERQVSRRPNHPENSRPISLYFLIIILTTQFSTNHGQQSGIKFNQDTSSYSGLTFTFDPRLDKRDLEWLHFEHWLSIMQQSSSLLYDSLNGRAHFNEIRVLIPYKWKSFEWPVIHKPGIPIINNRHLLFRDSDVIVGFEDPVYKETPYSVQHDECARPGLNIRMPISFLEQTSAAANGNPDNTRLKARQLVREFASHRYGVFKESGFRNDPMYPPFSALPGLSLHNSSQTHHGQHLHPKYDKLQSVANLTLTNSFQDQQMGNAQNIRGFDEHWNECSFETSPANGLPLAHSMNCAPYFTRAQDQLASFNLMSADPFSYQSRAINSSPDGPRRGGANGPLEWRDIAQEARWHFCGENFAPHPAHQGPIQLVDAKSSTVTSSPSHGQHNQNYAHNQLAINKQNVMCNERSAMEVIKMSDDFSKSKNSQSPSSFNRLPATNFKFMQEMPPRFILAVEYSAHSYQSHRSDHSLLEAAIGKFLAFDLIADSEFALILFGQQYSNRNLFKKLDSSLNSRLTYYSPPLDPFDESPRYYNEFELNELNVQSASSQAAKIIKGTCSFSKVMAEAFAMQQQQRLQYSDVGLDIVIITSGLFVEDEANIKEILKQTYLKSQTTSSESQLNLIIYPSSMLFDTKSKDNYIVLNSTESESIIKARLSKLQTIQRLTKAKIHLIKEHLDSNGEVKMSTLMQFHQIFDFISKGHSWDQTQSMVTLKQQLIEAKLDDQPSASHEMQHLAAGPVNYKLEFQFDVDQSLENSELIVGFIDPKLKSNQRSSGKKFSIKNFQLKSPGGHLFVTDQHPFPIHNTRAPAGHQHELMMLQNDESLGPVASDQVDADLSQTNLAAAGQSTESALFPFRSQLSLAGFHLKGSHLNQLNATNHKLIGRWTLTATSDEPIQTNGLAMAQVDPAGNSVTAQCWIQTYFDGSTDQLKQVKVFVQLKGAAHKGPVQEVQARLEIQDEQGNIVQNNQMLDDGLGSPDITKGDGILSQYVSKRAHRSGYYKANVEISGHSNGPHSDSWPTDLRPTSAGSGPQQDHTCCGSFMGQQRRTGNGHNSSYLSRQVYCGSFYVDSRNKLNQLKLPRVNNLTVVDVDHDSRRVRLRWFEPQVELIPQLAALKAAQDNLDSPAPSQIRGRPLSKRARFEEFTMGADDDVELVESNNDQLQRSKLNYLKANEQSPLSARYEIRLFNDRDILKRYFASSDSLNPKQQNSADGLGHRFNDLDVEGIFNNSFAFGGMKELTFRLPTMALNQRDAIYYVAMRVVNPFGASNGPMSNIISFYLKNNNFLGSLETTLDGGEGQYDSIYGLETIVGKDGNVYDKNTGELLSIAKGTGFAYSLFKGSSALDGLSVLIFISVLAFIFSILLITMIVCLFNSAIKSLGKHNIKDDEDKKVVTISNNGSASSSSNGANSHSSSSMVSDEVQSEVGSVGAGNDVEIIKSNNHYSIDDQDAHQNFNQLQQTHYQQQQQARLIDNQLKQQTYQQPALQYNKPDQQQQQWQLQHTIVNGYAYATVNQQQLQNLDHFGNLNQNGLQNQCWTNDVLLGHYDKVKQAREHHEALPVMSLEVPQSSYNDAGLPIVVEDRLNLGEQEEQQQQSYLIRPSYFNQQLQQQLSSVLKSKQQQQHLMDSDKSSPALEGLTDSHLIESQQQQTFDQHLMPPPQYNIYGGQVTNDPSIYSQVTNLQQVSSTNDASSFYANQGTWQQQSPAIYNQFQQQQLDASNSAISEV